MHTLHARLQCSTLSLSMSRCERIGTFSSLLTIIPGRSVAGPPANMMIRAPVLGDVVYNHDTWAFWVHTKQLLQAHLK